MAPDETEAEARPLELRFPPEVLAVHLELLQYPILGKAIRERMREQIFAKGVLPPARFAAESKEIAMRTQARERVFPAIEEPAELWQERTARIEELLTEYYFATSFPIVAFQDIVARCLDARGPGHGADPGLPRATFNAEIAPWSLLFSQGRIYERLPPVQQDRVKHHLREILVVLTKGMISDQLSFVKIAKSVLTMTDMEWVFRRRIGQGKIGGKAGGIMLARKILTDHEDKDPPVLRQHVRIPDANFIGSDVFYEFIEANGLLEFLNQKYKSYKDNLADFPGIEAAFGAGQLPERYRVRLQRILEEAGTTPLIVRSSSLLEDNFGVAFAGKYDSVFCPNQGTPEENFKALCAAIKHVYASALSPEALVYRERRGLIDYDERMAVLIQRVLGRRLGDYYFPHVAGVGFSYNPIIWNPRIKREEGFLRLVVGMGTRAVDRLGNDYARMVALSHPTLRPMRTSREICQYSQRYIDAINLKTNRFESVAAKDLLDDRFVHLRQIASLSTNGELEQIRMLGPGTVKGELVLTLDGLLQNRRFVETMRAVLQKLERKYEAPVDTEFVVDFGDNPQDDFTVHILQCRLQARPKDEGTEAPIPAEINDDDLLLVSRRMASTGVIRNIRYAVYVDPEAYRTVPDQRTCTQLARAVGTLNEALAGETFILIGPGRWGSSNVELGVPVSYAEIFNAKALVEVALPTGDHAPEASYGTHFFQDLIEAQIFPLPVYPGEEDALFDFDFFRNAPSALTRLAPQLLPLERFIKVVDFAEPRGRRLTLVMNARQERAVGYLTAPEQE